MPAYLVFKETAVPSVLVANAIYIVAPPERPGFIEIYVTDAAGTATRRTIGHADVQAMIDAAIAGSAGGSGTMIVDTIGARDSIAAEDRVNALTVLVVDASADETVTAGAATYVWRASTSTWIKVNEAESLDLSLTWAAISGRPQRSAAQIETAVDQSHTHANKTQLDKITEDPDGNLLYGGELPATGWNSVNW